MNIEAFIKTLIGCQQMNVLDFLIEKDQHHPDETVLIAKVALWEEERFLCPVCGQKCDPYDRLRNVKRWRSLDLGKNKFYVECGTPRCICPEHGVLVQRSPWAFPDSDYTKAFEVRVACAAARMPINLVSKIHRIKWHTVGSCARRVQSSGEFAEKKPARIRKIAIDETSYQVGHKYITVVQNLETNEVIWAHDGHGDEVLRLFFESLTDEQLGDIEYVVADGARWITRQVERYCPHAKRCVDPFHVVSWATEALDAVRRRLSDDTKKTICPLKEPGESHTGTASAA